MLKFYNTLTRKKDEFKPLEEGVVKIYTCGPTVYDYAHIGNLSAYLSVDLLKRYLRYSGYKVIDVMNLTDVDDKTIKASQENNKSLKEHTSFFTDILLEDFKKLNIVKPKILCEATEHIKEMIDLIQKLLDKGYAYKADDRSVYYKISAFKDYGKFARIKMEKLKTGASGRVNNDEYKKEDVADFVLWKAWSEADGVVYWDSPFGKGRPGWHIECSAMSMKYLGEQLDIHTGAVDLIFPHHQNEIAQSEAATGKQFVRFWLHREFLKIENEKMSKSLGNIYALKDVLKKVSDPLAFRYLILTNHYKTILNFTFDSLEASSRALKKLRSFIKRVSEIKEEKDGEGQNLEMVNSLIIQAKDNFKLYMDDDLNTPSAIADLFDFTNKINKLINEGKIGAKEAKLILDYLKDINRVWGFLDFSEKKISDKFRNKVEELIKKRNEYRINKEWNKADEVRDELSRLNVVIKDEGKSTKWDLNKYGKIQQ